MKTINWNGETFYGSVPINQNTFFEVHMCGHTPPNPDYEMFRYDNIVHVFEYVVSGKGIIETKESRATVGAGDFYLLKKGFTGHYRADPDDPYDKIWVNVRGELVDRLCDTLRGRHDKPLYNGNTWINGRVRPRRSRRGYARLLRPDHGNPVCRQKQ